MCPFCYIGKRRLESALLQFPQGNQAEIIWKSFQLNPDIQTNVHLSTHDYLAAHKGISLEQAKKMGDYVTQLAKEEGLEYNFDRAVVANSLKAHRFSHFAKKFGKQNEAEELLFQAYFTDGKNIDEDETLLQLGLVLELDTEALRKVLKSEQFKDEVIADIEEAQQVGVRGVPFFIFNRKYAISGAQEASAFLQTLEKVFETE